VISLKKSVFIPIIIVLLAPVSIYLTQIFPDYREGLSIVAEEVGLNETTIYPAPLYDYTISFIENPYLSTIIAGLVGVAIIYLVTYIVARSFVKKVRK